MSKNYEGRHSEDKLIRASKNDVSFFLRQKFPQFFCQKGIRLCRKKMATYRKQEIYSHT